MFISFDSKEAYSLYKLFFLLTHFTPISITKARICKEKFSVFERLIYTSVSQPPGRGPVPGPGINYTGPREILLEWITNLNVILYLSTYHTVHIIVPNVFMIMP